MDGPLVIREILTTPKKRTSVQKVSNVLLGGGGVAKEVLKVPNLTKSLKLAKSHATVKKHINSY